MKIVQKSHFWPHMLFMCIGLIFLPFLSSGQCNCPTEEECAPCEGGLTSLSLLYDGDEEVDIEIWDFWVTYFDSSVDPGETFTFEGTDDDGTFIWNRLYVSIDGDYEFTIFVNCPDNIFVNAKIHEDFTVMAGQSRDGGALCCAEGEGDNTPPEISNCPANINSQISGSACTATVTWDLPEAKDDCNVSSFISTHNPGDEFNLGTTTVTYTATDDAGNSSTCVFDVTLTDTSPPAINNCPANISVFASANQCGANVNWTPPEAVDNCSVSSFQSNYSSGDFFGIGTTEVTYTAMDNAGNQSTCSFNITVSDNKAPVFTNCPEDINISLEEGSCFATAAWNDPEIIDNCNLADLSSSHDSGDEFSVGTTEVIYTATDDAGNTATCSFNVTVTDDNNPVFSNCPEDIEVSTDAGKCSAIVRWTAPDVSDDCNFNEVTSTHSPGDEFLVGITEVIYTASDTQGNTATCSFKVTVSDNQAPVFSGCPDNIEIELTDSFCPQMIEWDLPEVSDCSSVELEASHEPGEEFEIGTTEITYTARDSSGNTSTCSFNIIISTNFATRLDQCPNNVTLVSETGDSLEVNWDAPEIAIECHSYTLSSNYNPGDEFGMGTTEVVYSVLGSEGVEETCAFNVTITDEENFPPESEHVDILLSPGQEIEICLDAMDPENDPLVIGEIFSENISGAILNPDSENLCFTYQAPENFTGEESIEVEICENTELNQCIFVQVNIEVRDNPGIRISQLISPDGDGINDLWIIENIEDYRQNKVSVFDRWGGLIFEAEGYDNESIVWDGLNNGKSAPTGTYFFSIEIEELSLVERGFIELINN